jgi:glycopeptide antibiotics resistance protein
VDEKLDDTQQVCQKSLALVKKEKENRKERPKSKMKCDDDDDALLYFSFILYFCCYVKFVSLFSPLKKQKNTYITELATNLRPKIAHCCCGKIIDLKGICML